MSDSFNFKKFRKNEHLELTEKNREDLIKTLIKSFEIMKKLFLKPIKK